MPTSTSLLCVLLAITGIQALPPVPASDTSALPAKDGGDVLLRSRPPVHAESRALTGRFLHITDLHPDPFYKVYADTSKTAACHRGHGPAGSYGAETSGCDTPLSLVNATFDWIRDNIRDDIDFIVWTGDSARHDNDERLPRSDKQVIELNEMMVAKFREVFARSDDDDDDPTNDFTIPIVPTFGNNDILPHNIFMEGPNRWTTTYLDIWRSFIPEAQRHQFQRGGWFQVEVIPNKLAIFSLNTMYFFDSNSGVDGCAIKSEPGYEHLEWLRIQLQILRERGMKAILIGHVPPARTENKQSWDETCWQKYTLWMRQYRDVITATLYGHMNIDHFMLQDFNDIRKSTEKGKMKGKMKPRSTLNTNGEVSIMSASDYLMDLRNEWANLPSPKKKKKNAAAATDDDDEEISIVDSVKDFFGWKKKGGKKRDDKFLEEIGGPWGERFSYSIVGPSVVPNYFPTLRIFEYNMTGLEGLGSPMPVHRPEERMQEIFDRELDEAMDDVSSEKKDKTNKKHKKKKKYKFTVPEAPSKSTPPGPAYSPQTLSLLGYTQFFANLTRINNDFHNSVAFRAASVAPSNSSTNPTTLLYADHTEGDDSDFGDGFGAQRWREGKHRGKKPKHPTPHPLPFGYEIFYQTFNKSDPYHLKDLTMRNYINLARHIGNFNSKSGLGGGRGGNKKKGKSKKGGKKNKDKKALTVTAEKESDGFSWEDGVDMLNDLVGDNRDAEDRALDILSHLKEPNYDDDGYDIYEIDNYESEDEYENEGGDIEAEKKKKKKKKKGKKKKGSKNHIWYTFIERAFVGTMDRDEIQEEFGWIPDPGVVGFADGDDDDVVPGLVADDDDHEDAFDDVYVDMGPADGEL